MGQLCLGIFGSRSRQWFDSRLMYTQTLSGESVELIEMKKNKKLNHYEMIQFSKFHAVHVAK